jgi:hypothetical protein
MHDFKLFLILQATKISDTIVGAAWWTWNESNQLSMKIMGIRSSAPVQLRGGHFILALTAVTAVIFSQI